MVNQLYVTLYEYVMLPFMSCGERTYGIFSESFRALIADLSAEGCVSIKGGRRDPEIGRVFQGLEGPGGQKLQKVSEIYLTEYANQLKLRAY